MATHRAPTSCPVCSHDLITLRVGCPACGTEISGHFEPCRFCRLDGADVELLEVFLRSRGNLRDVQAHLGVSYPTARQRFTDLLARMGLGEEPESVDSASVLRDLAAGRISVDDAEDLLSGTTRGGTNE
jgi:hypothetical protein